MVEFSRLVTTRKGQALNAKMIAGTGQVRFTKVCTSDEVYELGELESLEVLNNIKQTSPVSKITQTNEVGVKVETVFSNYELKTGYYMRTLGLYASGYDEDEILYAAAISVSDQCYMPPNNGITLSSAYINLIYAVGNSDNVSLDVDPGCFATIGDLKTIQEQLDKYISFITRLAKYSYDQSNNRIVNMLPFDFADGKLTIPDGMGHFDDTRLVLTDIS